MSIRVYRAIFYIFLAGGLLESCRDSSGLIQKTPVSTPQDRYVPSTPEIQPEIIELPAYEFPRSNNIQNRYLFYLHGKFIEDQGIPAISPEFGEYDYLAILGTFKDKGFIVISEERTKDTDSQGYAQRVTKQILQLLNAGVPAESIIVVGTSKGSGIAQNVSHLLNNKDVHFVILAICSPDVLEGLEYGQITLKGEILSIYDAGDEEAGTCRDLFSYSRGNDISRGDDIRLTLGLGHGILYQLH